MSKNQKLLRQSPRQQSNREQKYQEKISAREAPTINQIYYKTTKQNDQKAKMPKHEEKQSKNEGIKKEALGFSYGMMKFQILEAMHGR